VWCHMQQPFLAVAPAAGSERAGGCGLPGGLPLWGVEPDALLAHGDGVRGGLGLGGASLVLAVVAVRPRELL